MATSGQRGAGWRVARTGAAMAVVGASLLWARPAASQEPAGSAAGRAARGAPPRIFRSSDQCTACHDGLLTPSGEDVSIAADWGASMMANSARDPYWQAAIRREVLDHPGAREAIQDECSTCHMPMAHTRAHLRGRAGRVFAHLPVGGPARGGRSPGSAARLAGDGVSCAVCHQIRPEGLGTRESFVGGFALDSVTPWGEERQTFGPFRPDGGLAALMQSAAGYRPVKGEHVRRSALCATCHTLYTHARNEEDEVVGTLPEQVPYLEWLHSDYRDERSCQSCHMPAVADSVPVTGVLGQPRQGVNRHVFRGGNFLVLRMLARGSEDLGVRAPPRELTAAARRAVRHLRERAAEIAVEGASVSGDTLRFDLSVTNLAGHKLPTAYPSRRVWVHLEVRDRTGRTAFESGALRPDGSVEGNDNDADPEAYEPHHDRIRREEEVQVYEAIMVDDGGRVTTGVTTGARYVKDNRLLPRGFRASTAGPDIAVRGRAAEDPDFGGSGDRVTYSVGVEGNRGPFRVEAELLYQPIAYRWARNLAERDAPGIRRFLAYYDSMSGSSAAVLARAAATAGARSLVSPRSASPRTPPR